MKTEFEKFIEWNYPNITLAGKMEFERCWDAALLSVIDFIKGEVHEDNK